VLELRPLRPHARIALFFAAFVITACSAVLGVPDIYLDENAGTGAGDGSADGPGPNADGSSSGSLDGDKPPTCNTDLKTDKQNCGACGHDCSNGICTDGYCVLAENLPSPTHLAVRGNTIYFGLQGIDAISSCPTTGCASASVGVKKLTLDDAGSFQPSRVVANDTHVFAADSYGFNKGGVLRVPIAGGTMDRLPPNTPLERSSGIAIDNGAVYWTESEGTLQGVYACVLPSCPTPLKLSVSTSADLIAVGPDGAIVWAEGELRRCANRQNCIAANLITGTAPPGAVLDLAIDGATAYFGTSSGTIYSCSTAGCANATKIVETTTKAIIGAIAVNGTFLAWSEMPFLDGGNNIDDKAGVVKSCTIPNCSGAGVKVLATNQKDPSGMVLDAKSVYWSNSGKRFYVDGLGTLAKAPR
jgi:hypothetical protein